MHIITSDAPWDLSTRQIDIGLMVSATNTQSSSTGSATITINGHTVATGVSVTEKAPSNTDHTLLDLWGDDRSKLALTTIYANISKTDEPVTVTVTAAEGSADLLWLYTHSNSIPFIYLANLTYATVGNTRPVGTPQTYQAANANIVTGGATVDMTDNGWKTIDSGSNVSVNITGILGNIA